MEEMRGRDGSDWRTEFGSQLPDELIEKISYTEDKTHTESLELYEQHRKPHIRVVTEFLPTHLRQAVNLGYIDIKSIKRCHVDGTVYLECIFKTKRR